MTKYQTTITIPASGGTNRVRMSTALITAFAALGANGIYSASYLPCCKLFAQMQKGGTGLGFLGDGSVDQTGAGGALELAVATSSAPGASVSIESQKDLNDINAGDYYIHGANPGDVVSVWINQA